MGKKHVLIILLPVLLLGAALIIFRPHADEPPSGRAFVQEKKTFYHCPMHPNYTSDRPGDCPICGMRLVPMEGEAHAEPPAGERPKPEESESTPVEGHAAVKIPEAQQRMMGIITAIVRQTRLQKKVRTVGRVTYDETRVHHVHTKFEGYIENIFVNYVGQEVSAGQPLFSVYSPEVLATANEYLLALRASGRKGGPDLPGVNLVESAKQRLLLWDVDEREIDRLEKTGKAPGSVTVYSPAAGFITALTAVQGMRIMPQDVLYDISDLSKVWVIADIYENDLPFIRPGEEADITTPYIPSSNWKAKVTYVYPNLDQKTRTVKARLELDNPKYLLKPEMYSTVLIQGDLGEGLVVPESAVLTTGERKIVFVKKEAAVFEPREVVTGVRTQDYYEVKTGLQDGEEVVVEANFLLDSESKLKASIASMSGGRKH